MRWLFRSGIIINTQFRISLTPLLGRHSIAACGSLLLLSACGGGNSGSTATSMPVGSVSSQQAKTAPVHLSFAVQSPTLAINQRSKKYVSTSTTALTITVTPTGGTAQSPIYVNCSTSCTADFDAPVGSDSIALLLTDGSNGSGNPLSLSSTTVSVVPNVTNTFNLVANGVANSVTFTLGSANPLGGIASDVPVTVNVLDADGNTIIGPGNYVDSSGNPVTIQFGSTNSQAGGSGTMTLSQTSVSAPASSPITAHYDGGWLDHSTIAVTAPSSLASSSASLDIPTVPNVTEYSTGMSSNARPFDITSGPDGALWFTESAIDRIGRITTSGSIQEFSSGITAGASPYGITTGPDGRLWFAEYGRAELGAITPAGVVTEYPGGPTPREIVTGPDGKLWNTEQANVAIDTTTPTGILNSWSAGSISSSSIGITVGPDNALWYASDTGNKIGRISVSGSITGYIATGNPHYITTGPDGSLWFTQETGGCIGHITTAGTVSNFCSGFSGSPGTAAIVLGPDNNLWFTAYGANHIDRITASGAVTEFTLGLTAGSTPYGMVQGPDHALWFTEYNGNKIGRFVL
jgi:virginiamycin B lyase